MMLRLSVKPFTVVGFTWYEYADHGYPQLRSSRRFATQYKARQAGKAAGFTKRNLQVIDLDRY